MKTGEPARDGMVVLGVTGSIAAVEVVRLVHELRRHGFSVQGVMSHAATRIIHPDAVTYACSRPAITGISGMVEHIEYCGEGGTGDVFVIAPCTANTLCKIAAGIDDTPVTTFATTAIGRGMPVVLAPAMHQSMYRHPAVSDAIARLRSWGITVIDPRIEEGKAKIAAIEEIVLHVERALLSGPLSGRRVLITSGACAEPVDDVRILTTRSSGRMGRELAYQAFRLGADVTVVHADTFPCVRNVTVSNASEMAEAVLSELSQNRFDYYISAAAISDFAPRKFSGKIPSGTSLAIDLDPLPKLIDEVIRRYHPVTVAFKLGWMEEEKARLMLDCGISLVVVNTPEAMGAAGGSFILIGKDTRQEIRGTKEEVAGAIWTALL